MIAVLSGCALAGGWYAASSSIFESQAAAMVPALGAIAIAGVIPTLILQRNQGAKAPVITEQFSKLNQHAIVSTIDADECLTDVNQSFLDVTGFSRDEVIGKPARLFRELTGQVEISDIQMQLKRNGAWQGETRLRCKDETILSKQTSVTPVFDEDGKWAGATFVGTNVAYVNGTISDPRTENALYELNDGVLIISSDIKFISYMNNTAQKHFNVAGQGRGPRKLAEFKEDGGLKSVLKACRSLQQSADRSAVLQTVSLGLPVEINIRVLENADGADDYLVQFRDISARIEREKAKSAFISSVSHELRSPLTSIKGAMGLLFSGSVGTLPESARGLLGIAQRNTDRMILIINDLLDLDKISSGQMDMKIVASDVSELIKETVNDSSMSPQRFGVAVDLVGVDDPVMVGTDPNRFIQVLTNLLSNAYKFSKPKDRIIIKVEDEEDHVRISVEDHGPGIPEKDQHKIFQRFADMSNSDRAAKGGTGLGLSICKAIVESVGGSIGFETEEGVGTTFHFTLPKKQHDQMSDDATPEKMIA